MEIKMPTLVKKVWGHELIFHNTDEFCGKLLVFPKPGKSFSMHYHMLKNEAWYVQSGSFEFEWIDTEEGQLYHETLHSGQCVDITTGQPHRLTSMVSNSIIFEVSTQHFDSDSYRIYINSTNDWTKPYGKRLKKKPKKK
jgi:mannose-6-phosphate isomerase-like protein (cupin superfamily)